MKDPVLDSFAELLVERYDEVIERIKLASSAESKVPEGYESLRGELAALDPQTRDVLLRCVHMTAADVLAVALFPLFEFADNGDWHVSIDGRKLSDLTPGLHHELMLEGDGWLNRFSRHGPRPRE